MHGEDRADPEGVAGVWTLPELWVLAGAGLLSAVGDHVARVALTVLVHDRTFSALLTALTHALTFLPAVLGGPLFAGLAGLADRLPRRQLMVRAALVRAPPWSPPWPSPGCRFPVCSRCSSW